MCNYQWQNLRYLDKMVLHYDVPTSPILELFLNRVHRQLDEANIFSYSFDYKKMRKKSWSIHIISHQNCPIFYRPWDSAEKTDGAWIFEKQNKNPYRRICEITDLINLQWNHYLYIWICLQLSIGKPTGDCRRRPFWGSILRKRCDSGGI